MNSSLADRLKDRAHALGFELVGIAPAADADGFDRLRDWLDRDFAGEMAYMQRQAEARRHPASILPAVRSVLMVGLNYKLERSEAEKGTGPLNAKGPVPFSASGGIALYALGQDYHDVLRGKLNELLEWVQTEAPGTKGRGVVDTAPLLERDFARRAGLGWFGKNTMLIDKRLGSFFFLGALLLDLELPADAPFSADHCGTCTACLDACPTQAFAGPYELDARRCISYLTIELHGPIPEELRPGIGPWLFGCDVCQDVCPWNRKSPPGREPALQPAGEKGTGPFAFRGPVPFSRAADPIELLGLTEEAFRRRFRGTALWRTKRQGLVRNAAIVLGNSGDQRALPALEKATRDDDPVIQDAARWAIERILALSANDGSDNRSLALRGRE